jgi:hypothetical protein
MRRYLTPAAAEATACVLRHVSTREHELIAAERMLLCLLRWLDCEAGLVLRGLSVPVDDLLADLEPRMPVRSPESACDMRVESLSFYALAVEEADRLRDRDIGTDHLLLAIAREQDGEAEWPLRAGYEQVSAAVDELRAARKRGEAPDRAADDLPRETRPPVVPWAAGWIALQAFCCSTSLTGIPVGSVTGPTIWFLAAACWVLALSILLPIHLLRRKRWAWAAALLVGALHVSEFAAFGVLMAEVTRSYPGSVRYALTISVILQLSYALATLAVLWGLFQAGHWYGVDRRRRWHTMLQEGGWVFAVTLLFEGVALATGFLAR